MIEHYGAFAVSNLLSFVLFWESSPDLNRMEVVHIASVIQERANQDMAGGNISAVLDRVVKEGGQFACLCRETPDPETYQSSEKWIYCARMATLLLAQKIPKTERYTHFYSVHKRVPYWARERKAKRIGDTMFLRLEEGE